MGEIINFNPRQQGNLGQLFVKAADSPFLSSGPQPNFDDPHSGFFPEPTYNKTQFDFLSYSDEQILIRFATRNGLKMELVDDRQISFSKRLDLSQTDIKPLFDRKPPFIEIIRIECPDPHGNNKAFKSVINETGEREEAASLKGLMHIMNVRSDQQAQAGPEVLQ
jgi:hypothetical protein